jgi:hypothetical protein
MNFPDSKGKNKDPSFKRSIKITLEKVYKKGDVAGIILAKHHLPHRGNQQPGLQCHREIIFSLGRNNDSSLCTPVI